MLAVSNSFWKGDKAHKSVVGAVYSVVIRFTNVSHLCEHVCFPKKSGIGNMKFILQGRKVTQEGCGCYVLCTKTTM